MGSITTVLPALGDSIAQAAHDSSLSESIAGGLRSIADMIQARPELVRNFWDTARNIRLGLSSYDELIQLVIACQAAGAFLAAPSGWTFTTIEAWFGPVCLRMYVPQLDEAKVIPGPAILAQIEVTAK